MGSVTADGNNHISGLSYDTSGNTLTDGNNTYTWNGESQMKTAAGVTYSYDGDGRRAAKVGSKLYWYGSGGEILAETNTAGTTLNEYVFFGGKRVALIPASGGALYYGEDLLGSSRVMVQSNGTSVGAEKQGDIKLGAHGHAGLGLGMNINFSQAGRAWDRSVQSVDALGQYLMNKFIPTGSIF